MLFTLEALNANEGDCLLLSYGTSKEPRFVLIDGGPTATYNQALAPRLAELQKRLRLGSKPLPLDLWVVTHVDEDHIEGVLALMRDQVDRETSNQPKLADVAEMWLNTFQGVCGEQEIKEAITYLNTLPEARGTVSSVGHGRDLHGAARKFGIDINLGFKNLVARPDDAGAVVPLKEGLTFTVIGPSRAELDLYKKRWDEDMVTLRAKEARERSGHVSGTSLDRNELNRSSIAVLAEMGGRTMLLTGDARGDELLKGLEAAGKLAEGGTMKVDLFKLPHHGSDANVTLPLLERVIADNYVVSTNGKDKNPDVATLERLSQARGGEAYTMVCTFAKDAYLHIKDSEKNAKVRREALTHFHAWSEEPAQEKVRFVHREPNAFSVRVNLGDETIA